MAKTETRTQTAGPEMQPGDQMPVVSQSRMPYHPAIEKRFGITRNQWRTLTEAIFPNAQTPEAVMMAWEYCKARKLDPFKRQVHIVPVWSSAAKKMIETVWPGISELRTTATRTGAYAGMDAFEYGPDVTEELEGKNGTVTVTYPEWCRATVYKIVQGNRVPFVGPTVYWKETYATEGRNSDAPNAMWTKRPRGQLQKCTEAAALRMAFPEELGGEYAAEEMEGKTIDGSVMPDTGPAPDAPPRPTRKSIEAAETTSAPTTLKELAADLESVGHTADEVNAWLEQNDDAVKALPQDDYVSLQDHIDGKLAETEE